MQLLVTRFESTPSTGNAFHPDYVLTSLKLQALPWPLQLATGVQIISSGALGPTIQVPTCLIQEAMGRNETLTRLTRRHLQQYLSYVPYKHKMKC